MKIACVGAGPAGLYFAILTKLRDPAAEVTVYERNPPGVTYGWGVDTMDTAAGLDALAARRTISAARRRARWSHVR